MLPRVARESSLIYFDLLLQEWEAFVAIAKSLPSPDEKQCRQVSKHDRLSLIRIDFNMRLSGVDIYVVRFHSYWPSFRVTVDVRQAKQ